MNFHSTIFVKFLATVGLLAYSNIGFSWEFHDCKGVGETCEAATQNAIEKCKRPAARSCGLLQQRLGDVAFKSEREQQAPGFCQVTGILIYSCIEGTKSAFNAADLANWTFVSSLLPVDLANLEGYAFAEARSAAPGSVARRVASENAVSASVAGNFMAATNASGGVNVDVGGTTVEVSASGAATLMAESVAGAPAAVAGAATVPTPAPTLPGCYTTSIATNNNGEMGHGPGLFQVVTSTIPSISFDERRKLNHEAMEPSACAAAKAHVDPMMYASHAANVEKILKGKVYWALTAPKLDLSYAAGGCTFTWEKVGESDFLVKDEVRAEISFTSIISQDFKVCP